MAMMVAGIVSVGVIGETADARGPAYDGPETVAGGPAYFGPAPNPFPYCDSPTYFDPFPENIDPIGRMGVVGNGDGEPSTASVTTDGVTMDLTITSEGNPGTRYPGFFPNGADGSSNDRAKGIELAEGDGASVELSAPLFYSQWIFTDVDQPNEGFTVTPKWTEVGQAAAFAGDNNFTFAGTTNTAVELDDTDGDGHPSQAIEGRVQVDFLGAVTGIDMLRTYPSNGQSGFAVGGGCEAAGAAKVVTSGPTWNGTSFDVTYDLRMRNNLPSSDTIQAVINDAIAGVGESIVTGDVEGIDLENLQLTDDLRDPAFSNIVVTAASATGNLVLNDSFDGVTDFDLIESGSIAAESDEVITISVQYTPDLSSGNWDDCSVGYTYLNQTEVSGSAANVDVDDLSDNGTSAAPSDDNGDGGVDDPTPVTFPCPPGALEIVKTVLPGEGVACPSFDDGIPGDGPTLETFVGDYVTYCVSVRNPGPGPVTNVVVTDAQAGSPIPMTDLDAGQTDTTSYTVQVDLTTPSVNTAIATGDDADGPLDPVQDTAVINVSSKQPQLDIVKTVVEGPDGTCPTYEAGIRGIGPALIVDDGDTVTYCISVRNIGDGEATNVVVSDTQRATDFDLGTMPSGDTRDMQYDVTVDLTTPTVNTATASGEGPDGPLDDVEDQAQIAVEALPDPDLQIVKTALEGPGATCPSWDDAVLGLGDPVQLLEGDTVTYCIIVRNVGAGPAFDVVLADDQAPGTFDANVGELASGESATRTYDITDVTVDTPEVNTVTANGRGLNGDLPEISDPAVINVSPQPDPALEIVKTVVLGPDGDCPSFDDGVQGPGPALEVVEGQTVTYCVSVRNTGEGDAFDVMVSDDEAPDSPYSVGTLLSGEERLVRYDLPVNSSIALTNTAVVTGKTPSGEDADPDDDDAVIDTFSANISLIHSVSKADEECLTVAKNLNSLVANSEDLPIIWCAQITNNGSVALANVTLTVPDITDGQPIDALANHGSDVLEPDDTIYLQIPGTIPDNGVISNGETTGDPVDDDGNLLSDVPSPSDTDDAQVLEASIDIETTVAEGADADCADAEEVIEVPTGSDITWCFVVTNTGAVDLLVKRITDPDLGITVELPVELQVLPKGGSFQVQTNDVAEGPVEIDADVKGKPLDGNQQVIDQAPEVEDIDPARIVIPNADLALEKDISDEGPVDIGEEVTYTLIITNNGPNTARGVSVTDDLPVGIEYTSLPNDADWVCALDGDARGFSCLKGTDMASGDEVTLTYTARITGSAVPNADLTNTARVDSETPDDDPSNNEDSSTTRTPPADEVIPRTELPEYPGPFTPPAPPLNPPDEVLGLAITGAASNLLGLISAVMLAIGGLLMVGARRTRRDD